MVSYVVVSYVTKSLDVSTLYLLGDSTTIPFDVSSSIPYFSDKSGLSFIFIASAVIFYLLHCIVWQELL